MFMDRYFELYKEKVKLVLYILKVNVEKDEISLEEISSYARNMEQMKMILLILLVKLNKGKQIIYIIYMGEGTRLNASDNVKLCFNREYLEDRDI